MRTATAILVLAGLMSALAPPASAGPTPPFEAQATWSSLAKNQPPGMTTRTATRLRITPTPDGYQACLIVEVSLQRNSPRSSNSEGVSQELGCVSNAPLTVADDLSTATLAATAIPLDLLVRTCSPETPDDCVTEFVPSRTVTTTATWTANEPLFSACNGVMVELRGATATATLNGTPLGASSGSNETNYILRYTKKRC